MQRLNTRPSSHHLSPVRAVVFVFSLAWISGVAAPVQAGLLIGVVGGDAKPGTTSDFGVTLTNTGTTSAADVLIAGFAFEITAAGNDVTFIATDDSIHPYIFEGYSLFSPDITLAISPDGHTISAADNYATPLDGITLAHGQSVWLGRVSFSLSPSTPIGQIPLAFTPDPTTGVNDPDGIQYTVFLQTDAHIDVIPEPATITSLGIGVVGAIVSLKRRRRLVCSKYRTL